MLRKAAAGGASLVILAILFWLIFYQNLPGHPLNSIDPNEFNDTPIEKANVTDRIVKLFMLAFGFATVVSKFTLSRNLVKNGNLGLMMFIVLAPLSALWSIDSNATLLRFTTMASIIVTCFAITLVGFDRRRLQKMVMPPMMAILVISLILGAIYPDRIIEVGDDLSLKNAWHGITLSKNQFGMMASLGTIFCFHRWLAGTKGVVWSALGTFAAAACLLLSRSNTSLFATMVGVMGLVGLMRVHIIKQRFSAHLVIGISGVILLYQLAIQDVVPGVSYLLAPITSLTGKDTTFSSRTFIWNIIKEHIAARPLLGSGFGAYWTGPFESSPSYVFVYLMYFYPTESHNGYLEMMNDLGIPGVACILFFVVWYTRQGLALMRYDRGQAALHFAVLFQQLVMNMSESEWFSRTSSFAVLLLSCCCLSRSLYEYRSQGPPTAARA